MKCPFISGNRKCTHKDIELKKSKIKRMCGYGDPKDCDFYNDWVVTAKPHYIGSQDVLAPYEDEDEP